MPDTHACFATAFAGPGGYRLVVSDHQVIRGEVELANVPNKLEDIVTRDSIQVANPAGSRDKSEAAPMLEMAKGLHIEQAIRAAARK